LKSKKIKIIIELKNKNNKKIKEEIEAEINPGFNSDREMVIRKSDFVSIRTLGIKANKGAFELNRRFIDQLSNPDQEICIYLEPVKF